MFKRSSKGNMSSPAKKFKLDISKEPNLPRQRNSLQGDNPFDRPNSKNDVWGDDFGEEEIEEMDFIASQVTQEEAVFATPKPVTDFAVPSTSSGIRGIFSQKSISRSSSSCNSDLQSQVIGSSDIRKEILESTQAIMFDDFENNIKSNSLNSTFRCKQSISNNNSVVVISDDHEVEKWKEEKKKLLEDFMTKEGETEFLRQQLNQIQTRAENAKKEQAQLLEEQTQKYRELINNLQKDKNSLESQFQLQNLQLNALSEKCKLLESGSIKFTQPQVNMVKSNRDKNNSSMSWSVKKVKTKENSVQVDDFPSQEILKIDLVQYPLKTIPQSIFEPPEPEKSVVEIKLEEKIGKRNLAIIQDEETFRIFENPELSKPKITIVNGKTLNTQFFSPDLARLINKTSNEINSSDCIPIINKLVATSRELLLNSTSVLQNISQALQNDDIRDMNEVYFSEFYEMPVPHTKSFCAAHAWYNLERGVETRRAIGVMSHIVLQSQYLADYVAGNLKLKSSKDSNYEDYAMQMKSYEEWPKKGIDFEFLDLIEEFVTVVGLIRRSHQFAGLINAMITLICNVQNRTKFSSAGLNRICHIFKEIIYGRPLLASFIPISSMLEKFSECPSFVNKLCICPDKSGINYWKGSLNFVPGTCTLEIFIVQLEYFKLDPITLINMTNNLTRFSHIALLNYSIPWVEQTKNSCNCCLNLLKFVIRSLYECSKIIVDELKNNYAKADIKWRITKQESSDKKRTFVWKDEILEDWNNFEKNQNENFWNGLRTVQYSALSYGIRLLSYLAKRDLDFMIRSTCIEDAFHLFLNNLGKRKDLKLKESDEIALDIVRKTFVLEKNKDENSNSQHKQNIVELLKENWTDYTTTSLNLMKLFDD